MALCDTVPSRRRHILSFLSEDAREIADLALRARHVLGQGTLFVVGASFAAARAEAGQAIDGWVVRGEHDAECRFLERSGASQAADAASEAAVAGFPELWMSREQRAEASDVVASGGALFVFVARSGDAAREGLKAALGSLGRRVRLHEFSAAWAGDRGSPDHL